MEKILRYFAKDKLLIALATIAIISFGLISLRGIKKEAMPPVDIDQVNIYVIYPGASAVDVELNAVIPIEEELKKIIGIEEFGSVSLENSAVIVVNIDLDIKDKQAVKDEIFRKISRSNIKELPDEVEDVLVVNINPKLKPVYAIGITPKEPEKTSDRELFDMADRLDKLLSRVNGVSDVGKSGYREREIHIDVDPRKMDQLYVSLNDVTRSIQTRNIRFAGGTLQSLHREKTIITIGQFSDPLEVGEVIIRSGFERRGLRVKDIAKVTDSFRKEYQRFRVNRRRAVVLVVRKNENADIIETVGNIKRFIQDNKVLYDDKYTLTVVSDDSKRIDSLLGVVASNAIIGFVLVIIVLFVFLDFRTSFWTAFSIPFCLLMVMGFMYVAEISLNMLTLGAIVTVLGMMVDDAIVVAEVIHRKKQSGLPSMEAAVQGTREILGPVTVTILSTITAFLPMLMIKGIMGKFIYIYPVIITATLLASLFEASFFLPNHLSHGKPVKSRTGAWFEPVAAFYESFLKKALRFRYFIVAGFIALFVATVFLSIETIKGFVLFWDDTSETIEIDLAATRGTPLARMEELTTKIETAVEKKIPRKELFSVFTKTGRHSGTSAEHYEHWSNITLQLVPRAERERTASEIIASLKKDISTKKYPVFKQIVFKEKKAGPPTGAAVDIKIISDDEKKADLVRADLQAFLAGIQGVRDIDNDRKKGKEELVVRFDYSKLAQYGMTVQAVAATVRTAFEGSVASSMRTPKSKIDFRVQVDDGFKKDEKYLLNLLIPNKEGRLIRLRQIARIVRTDGRASVKHYNGDRAISVTANVDADVISSGEVNRSVMRKFKNIPKRFPNTYLVFSGEKKQSDRALGDLGIAFLMALVLIYFIVVLLYRSLSQPLIVLSVIPFGLIGVLLAFTVHDIPLSFMGIIGVIGLSGVVINDSVIMVSFINQVFRARGTNGEGAESAAAAIDSIAAGAGQRLRPIVLTTITTVAGLLPTVYGIGGNAAALVPTVMAMAYGLLFATLLTLILIPTLYLVHVDAGRMIGRLTDRIAPRVKAAWEMMKAGLPER